MKKYLEDATKEELKLEIKRREITDRDRANGEMINEICKINGDGHVTVIIKSRTRMSKNIDEQKSFVAYMVITDIAVSG